VTKDKIEIRTEEGKYTITNSGDILFTDASGKERRLTDAEKAALTQDDGRIKIGDNLIDLVRGEVVCCDGKIFRRSPNDVKLEICQESENLDIISGGGRSEVCDEEQGVFSIFDGDEFGVWDEEGNIFGYDFGSNIFESDDIYITEDDIFEDGDLVYGSTRSARQCSQRATVESRVSTILSAAGKFSATPARSDASEITVLLSELSSVKQLCAALPQLNGLLPQVAVAERELTLALLKCAEKEQLVSNLKLAS